MNIPNMNQQTGNLSRSHSDPHPELWQSRGSWPMDHISMASKGRDVQDGSAKEGLTPLFRFVSDVHKMS